MSPTNLPSSGRVEVFYNGKWGTICDNLWGSQDADVACRQLGYDGALSAPRAAAFGQGTGPIWLDKVGCFGNENPYCDAVTKDGELRTVGIVKTLVWFANP